MITAIDAVICVSRDECLPSGPVVPHGAVDPVRPLYSHFPRPGGPGSPLSPFGPVAPESPSSRPCRSNRPMSSTLSSMSICSSR